MKNLTLIIITVFLFFHESKAQFNSAKYDSYREYESRNKKIKIYKVKLNEKWGVVDSKGKELIPNEYDKIKEIIAGVIEIEPLIQVEKDGFKGVLNLKNNFVVPLSNWIDINNSGPFLTAVKQGPFHTQYNYSNENMDTSFLFNWAGNLLWATDKHYNFKSFDVDTCITENLYLIAKKTKDDTYNIGFYDFFIIKPGQQPKNLFEYSQVELWPDKMFYVKKQISRSYISKVSFYSIEGELISTKGNYTSICCKDMYPRYEAEEFGKFDRYYQDGLLFIIDTSGNKLSEGYSRSTIVGGRYYEEDGYFYKIYNRSSITPLCPPSLPKSVIQNKSKLTTNKTILSNKIKEAFTKINKYEDIILSTIKYVGQDHIESYLDFNGKNITGWYKRIMKLPGKYYDKVKNLVYNGGNYEVMGIEQNGEKSLHGIFSLVAKKEILPTKYDEIRLFEDGIYRLKLEDKYGLWFQKDNILIETIYDEIDEYPNRVKFGGKWGKIEKSIFVPF